MSFSCTQKYSSITASHCPLAKAFTIPCCAIHGCIVGGTRPMDMDVVVGTRSTVGRGQYSGYDG